MCTAISDLSGDFYFGRTLDLEYPDTSEITFTPRNFPLSFRNGTTLSRHLAILGMARTEKGYPLYYDGFNEAGLAIAGLDFSGNACYPGSASGDKLCHFEVIPWILSQCVSLDQARKLLKRMSVIPDAFSPEFPVAELHWFLSDRTGSLTLESTPEGLHVYENPVGVLTNNPPFPEMLSSLNRYLALTPEEPVNRFSSCLDLKPHSHGMGAIGLPGDLSSQSRFVRAAFTKLNSIPGTTEADRVTRFFHVLSAVNQIRGCSRAGSDRWETTVYTSCCNTTRGIYYYTTYENRQISAVYLNRLNPEDDVLRSYPRIHWQQILSQN